MSAAATIFSISSLEMPLTEFPPRADS